MPAYVSSTHSALKFSFKKVYVFGNGGHGKVVSEIIEKNGTENESASVVFVNSDGSNGALLPEDIPSWSEVVVAIGDNLTRLEIVGLLTLSGKNLIFPIVSHPTAYISPSVSIDKGSVLCVNSVINTRARIGKFCIINTAATIDHDCVIGDYVHIAPGVNLCGNVKVGSDTIIGVGSSVIPGVRIGHGCIVGAGSVVVSDLPERTLCYGNPARVIKDL